MGKQSAKVNNSEHRQRILSSETISFVLDSNAMCQIAFEVPYTALKNRGYLQLLACPIENSKDQRLTWKAA
jgi:hypothetical protein